MNTAPVNEKRALTLRTVEEIELDHSIYGFTCDIHRVQRIPSSSPTYSYGFFWSFRTYKKVTYASARRLMKALDNLRASPANASIYTGKATKDFPAYSSVTLTYSVEPNYRTR